MRQQQRRIVKLNICFVNHSVCCMLIETTKVAKYKHKITKNANPSMSDWSVTPRDQFFAKLYFFQANITTGRHKKYGGKFVYDTSKTGGTDRPALKIYDTRSDIICSFCVTSTGQSNSLPSRRCVNAHKRREA